MQLTQNALSTMQKLALNGQAYLNVETGQELIEHGLIVVNENQTAPEDPHSYLCCLSDAGLAFVTGPDFTAAPVVTVAPVAPAMPSFPPTMPTMPVAPVMPTMPMLTTLPVAPVMQPVAPVMPTMPVAPVLQVAPILQPDNTVVISQADVATVNAADLVAKQVQISLRNDIALPTTKRKKGDKKQKGPKFPFEQMEIGHSFHVPYGSDAEKTGRSVSMEVSRANASSKVLSDPPQIVTVTKHRYKRDAEGNFLRNEEGTKLRESYQEQEQLLIQTKFFVSRKVNADDPEGEGIRVFRVPQA